MLAREGSIALVINSLEGGGAERVMSLLAARLAERGRPVRLVTLDRIEDRYPLPHGLMRERLDCRGSLPRSIAALGRFVRRNSPELLLSFLTRANVATVLCGRLQGTASIVSERVHTTSHFGDRHIAVANRLMVRAVYPMADRVVAVSDGVKADLVANYGVPENRIETIHNPVDADRLAAAASSLPSIDLPGDFFVAAGRLVPNKNFVLLVRAFAAAGVRGHLVILGEGPQRTDLEALSRRLGLADRIHLPGRIANPHAVFSRARAYVSSSNAEGFPNALVEAMSLGRPVISTDCPAGPAEILGAAEPIAAPDGLRATRHGILVPMNDVFAMSSALCAVSDPETAATLAEGALARARDFGVEDAVARYEAAIDRVLAARRCIPS